MSLERAAVVARIAEIVAAVERPHPVRVAIDGVDAAGKTTLADELAPLVGRPVVRASVDGFHRPRAERGDTAESYYADAFDYDALRRVLLDPLGPGGSRRYRAAVFDLALDEPLAEEWQVAPEDAVLLCDGVFLHRPQLAGCWDLTVLVAVDLAVALERAIARDGEAMRGRYARRYVPAQRRYLAEVRPEERADVVVDNTDPQRPRLVRAVSATSTSTPTRNVSDSQ